MSSAKKLGDQNRHCHLRELNEGKLQWGMGLYR